MLSFRFVTTVLSITLVSVTTGGCSGSVDTGDELADLESELAVKEIVPKGSKLRVVAPSGLNLRAEASTSSAVVASLANGAIVTAATTSGGNGWVNVTTGSRIGWAFGKYLQLVEGGPGGDDADDGPVSGDTCDPSRGRDVVPQFQKALHDAIAFAEGTRGRSKDGYDVMYSYKIMSTCARHPNQCLDFGNTCSTAAGRYQFLKKTWDGAARVRGFTTFEPENQEKGAAYLIASIRKVNVPEGRAMTRSEFELAMGKLSYEWASLPPGRYGQGFKSMSTMWSTYCSFAGCQ